MYVLYVQIAIFNSMRLIHGATKVEGTLVSCTIIVKGYLPCTFRLYVKFKWQMRRSRHAATRCNSEALQIEQLGRGRSTPHLHLLDLIRQLAAAKVITDQLANWETGQPHPLQTQIEIRIRGRSTAKFKSHNKANKFNDLLRVYIVWSTKNI